jgi:glycosyltransferase involved in cell wall biosynthesis
MTPARVAIAIPAYNARHTIGETLDALQECDRLDDIGLVVLLDDCCTDDTAAVARERWTTVTPLEVWRNANNMGERRTTNAAIARLSDSFEWTFILHADDVVKPLWLSLYLDELGKLPDTVATICSSYDNWWPTAGRIEAGEEEPGVPAVHVPGERSHVLGTLEKGCWWHLSGCGLRNRAFLDIGGFEPDMPQLGDWEWLLRCLVKGYGVWYVPRTTMLYRQHDSSVSSRSFREAQDLREKLRILRSMHVQGYLDEAKLKAQVRRIIRQMARRSLVRGMRGDGYGLRKHASLLMGTGAGYLRGKL